MKGYKAFEKGMICKGKQYAENTVFEEDTAKICESGDNSQLELNGLKSVGANIGVNGKIKGKKGNWIVLAEYGGKRLPLCVKSAQIDGEKIKEDTFYQLKNGEFVEADE